MAIFNSYVKLPEGISHDISIVRTCHVPCRRSPGSISDVNEQVDQEIQDATFFRAVGPVGCWKISEAPKKWEEIQPEIRGFRRIFIILDDFGGHL